ncbi:hypothetical protein INR49_021441 [Caranx melampygus]|nr:hypothetical protein INR49_021441 [Caranx melampygus]
MMVALTQMSGFGGAGLGTGGVRSWNVLPCGPADFVEEGVNEVEKLREGGRLSPAPLFSHHVTRAGL